MYVSATSLELEGLYRVSGSKVEVDALKAVLKEGAPLPSQLLDSVADKHAIAGAIKKVHTGLFLLICDQPRQKCTDTMRWSHLRRCTGIHVLDPTIASSSPLLLCPPTQVLQEHEPLLSYALYDRFLAMGSREDGDKDEDYTSLVGSLAPVAQALLSHLMDHIRKVRVRRRV